MPVETLLGTISYEELGFDNFLRKKDAPVLKANALTLEDILNGILDWNDIPNVLVSTSQIEDGAIETAKIDDGAVTETKISDGAITTDKILNEAITELKLAAQAVSYAKIQVGAIHDDVIAAGAITETKISDNAISTPKLQAGAVTAAKIAAGAVTAEKIYAGAVTTEKIAAGAVTADKITAGAVTTLKLATGAVTTEKISAGAITADKIAVSSLSAISANLGTITAGIIYGTYIATQSIWPNVAIHRVGDTYPHNIVFTESNGDTHRIYASNGNLNINAYNWIVAGICGIRPVSDTQELGNSSYYWHNIYLNHLKFNPSYGKIYWGSDIVLNIGTPNSACMTIGKHLYPSSTAAQINIGTTNQYFNAIYANYLYYHTGYYSFDKYDDLELIKKIDVKNPKTFPEEVMKEGFYNLGAFNGLIIGVLKQLIQKVEMLEQKIQ